jgi:hypothetical protein
MDGEVARDAIAHPEGKRPKMLRICHEGENSRVIERSRVVVRACQKIN